MDSSVLPEPLCTLLKSALGASASVLPEPLCTLEKSAFLSPPLGASDSESGSLGFLGLLIGASCAAFAVGSVPRRLLRSEEHTSELQSLMRISYAVFCLKKKK